MLHHRIRALGTVGGVGAILLAALAGGAAAQLQNDSFELPNAVAGDVPGTAGWASFNFVYTTATIDHYGNQCLKTFGPFVPAGGSGATQMLPALPGQTWVGEVWALNWSGDPLDTFDFGVFKIEFLDANSQLAAGGLAGVDIFESNPINATLPQDIWQLLGVGTAPAPAGTVWARAVIVKVDLDGAQGGSIFWDDARLSKSGTTAVSDTSPLAMLQLRANSPNPFGSSTRLDFAIAKPGPVDISVYDIGGRVVMNLVRADLTAGSHSVTWDGTLISGASAPAGIYRCVMRTSAGQASRIMHLVR